MLQVAFFVVRPESVPGDDVPFDPDVMTVAQDSLVQVVVEMIAAKHDACSKFASSPPWISGW
jgi:hypothetical protein